MPDFTVHQYGVDTSHRPIFMTAYMHDWWEAVVAELGFRPVIVQGAFMARVAGGGAAASAGYHDAGGCIDVRTWNLTREQADQMVRVVREHGAAIWRRDEQHGGMDPHAHITLGTDSPLTAGARASWQSYLDGHDGLASNGPDYEWRPSPLVTTPPEEDDMPYTEKQLAKIVRDAVQIKCPDGVVRPLSQALRNVMRTQDAEIAALRRILAKANTGLSAADKADIEKMLADAVIDVDVKVNGD